MDSQQQTQEASFCSQASLAPGQFVDINIAPNAGFYKNIMTFDDTSGGTSSNTIVACIPCFLSIGRGGTFAPFAPLTSSTLFTNVAITESSNSRGSIDYTLVYPASAVLRLTFGWNSNLSKNTITIYNASPNNVAPLTNFTFCSSYDGIQLQ